MDIDKLLGIVEAEWVRKEYSGKRDYLTLTYMIFCASGWLSGTPYLST